MLCAMRRVLCSFCWFSNAGKLEGICNKQVRARRRSPLSYKWREDKGTPCRAVRRWEENHLDRSSANLCRGLLLQESIIVDRNEYWMRADFCNLMSLSVNVQIMGCETEATLDTLNSFSQKNKRLHSAFLLTFTIWAQIFHVYVNAVQLELDSNPVAKSLLGS